MGSFSAVICRWTDRTANRNASYLWSVTTCVVLLSSDVECWLLSYRAIL